MLEPADRLQDLVAATALESITLREVTARREASDDPTEKGNIALRIDDSPGQGNSLTRTFALRLRVTLHSGNASHRTRFRGHLIKEPRPVKLQLLE